MSDVQGPVRIHLINENVHIREDQKTGAALMVHTNTDTVLKKYAAVVGMEEGAWMAMIAYAERVVQLTAIAWETDDIDFLFPSTNFTKRYLDPVGFEQKSIVEISAELMEKPIRKGEI